MLSLETNPIPIKAALAMTGRVADGLILQVGDPGDGTGDDDAEVITLRYSATEVLGRAARGDLEARVLHIDDDGKLGELARSIEQVEGVENARVQLAIPKRKTLP